MTGYKLLHKKNEFAIKLVNVTKIYSIHHEKPTLIEKFIKGRDERFVALNDINLTIGRGESVGLIGQNGSGKTTLLKIIAGITSPSRGKAYIDGRVVSLIDLNAGFHSDLSGYQNIYLNGLFLGMSKKEIDNKLNKIVALAGIRQFIDAPFFTYSQGMKLRLGFAVAVHSDPDILLLDENFAVGDEKFTKKSQRIIKDLKSQKKTILIASHWRDFLKKNCTRIISIKDGSVLSDRKNKNQIT